MSDFPIATVKRLSSSTSSPAFPSIATVGNSVSQSPLVSQPQASSSASPGAVPQVSKFRSYYHSPSGPPYHSSMSHPVSRSSEVTIFHEPFPQNLDSNMDCPFLLPRPKSCETPGVGHSTLYPAASLLQPRSPSEGGEEFRGSLPGTPMVSASGARQRSLDRTVVAHRSRSTTRDSLVVLSHSSSWGELTKLSAYQRAASASATVVMPSAVPPFHTRTKAPVGLIASQRLSGPSRSPLGHSSVSYNRTTSPPPLGHSPVSYNRTTSPPPLGHSSVSYNRTTSPPPLGHSSVSYDRTTSPPPKQFVDEVPHLVDGVENSHRVSAAPLGGKRYSGEETTYHHFSSVVQDSNYETCGAGDGGAYSLHRMADECSESDSSYFQDSEHLARFPGSIEYTSRFGGENVEEREQCLRLTSPFSLSSSSRSSSYQQSRQLKQKESFCAQVERDAPVAAAEDKHSIAAPVAAAERNFGIGRTEVLHYSNKEDARSTSQFVHPQQTVGTNNQSCVVEAFKEFFEELKGYDVAVSFSTEPRTTTTNQNQKDNSRTVQASISFWSENKKLGESAAEHSNHCDPGHLKRRRKKNVLDPKCNTRATAGENDARLYPYSLLKEGLLCYRGYPADRMMHKKRVQRWRIQMIGQLKEGKLGNVVEPLPPTEPMPMFPKMASLRRAVPSKTKKSKEHCKYELAEPLQMTIPMEANNSGARFWKDKQGPKSAFFYSSGTEQGSAFPVWKRPPGHTVYFEAVDSGSKGKSLMCGLPK